MIRWINADTLREKMDDLCEWKCKYTLQEKHEKCKTCTMGMAFDLVKDMDFIAHKPSKSTDFVEFQPIKRGHWNEVDGCMTVCSRCGMLGCGTPYCAYCGAEMDEVEDGKID